MDAGRQSIRVRCQGTRKLMVDLPLGDREHEKDVSRLIGKRLLYD